MNTLVQYGAGSIPYHYNYTITLQRVMLPNPPTAGNVVFAAISSNTPVVKVYDNQGNKYSLIQTKSGAGGYVYLYAAVIQYSGANPNGGYNYPGGYLEVNVSTGNTNCEMAVCAFEVNMGNAASSVITATSANATNTSTSPSVGPITFAGTGLDIGVFGWNSAAAGTISLPGGSNYQLLYSQDWVNFTQPGLAVIVNVNDSTGSATPKVNFSNSIQWAAVGSVVTAPAALIAATVNTPNGIPSLQVGQTYNFNVTGINVNFSGNPFSVSGASLVSQSVASANTAHVSISPTGKGNFTITDTLTGASVLPQGPQWQFQMPGYAGQWWGSNYWYVNSAIGNDTTGNGTITQPFATLSGAILNTSLSPCDAILLSGSFNQSTTLTATGYYFWTTYGGGNADITSQYPSNVATMILSQGCGMYMSNVNVNNSVSAASMSGIFHGVGSGGVFVRHTDGLSHTDGFAFLGVNFSGGNVQLNIDNSGGPGIIAGGIISNCNFNGAYSSAQLLHLVTDTHVLNCNLTNIPGYNVGNVGSVKGGEGLWFSQSYSSSGNTVRVWSCNFANNGSGVVGTAGSPCTFLAWQSDGIFFTGNVVKDQYNGANSADSCAIDFDIGCQNCTADYNFVGNADGAGLYAYNSNYHVFRYNISYNAGRVLDNSICSVGPGMTAYCNTAISFYSKPTAGFSNTPYQCWNNLLSSPQGVATIAIQGVANTSSFPLKIDGNCSQSTPVAFRQQTNSGTVTNYTTLAGWKNALASAGMGGTHEVGPFATQIFDCDPYVGDWVASNIPTIAARFAPVAGSPAATTPLNFASNGYFINCLPPYDIAGNRTSNAGAIGAVCVPTNNYASSYDAAIMAVTPYSRWKLGETSGIYFFDSMGTQLPMTLYGGLALGQSDIIPGDSRGNPTISNSNTYASNSSSNTATATGLTAMCWLYSTAGANYYLYGGVYAPDGSKNGYVLRTTNAANNPYFAVRDTSTGTSYNITVTGVSLQTNTLYHLAAVYDGSSLQMYVNGAKVDGTIAGSPPTSLYVGGTSLFNSIAGTTTLRGSVKDAVTWTQPLTANQISNIYNAGLNIIIQQLQAVGQYPNIFTPNPSGANHIFNGGTVFAGGPVGTNIVKTLNYPHLGINARQSANLPVVNYNTGVAEATSGSFANMVKGQYVIMVFNSQLAGNPTSLLTSPAKYNTKSQNRSIGVVNTKLVDHNGGWYYDNGLPVNVGYSTDTVSQESATNYSTPGRFTFMTTPANIQTQTYPKKND